MHDWFITIISSSIACMIIAKGQLRTAPHKKLTPGIKYSPKSKYHLGKGQAYSLEIKHNHRHIFTTQQSLTTWQSS